MYKIEKNHKIKYPETHVGDQIDQYFSTEVADPYRWLEDDCSEQTANWVEEQNHLTESVLSQIPGRDAIKSQLKKQLDFEKFGMPFVKGEYIWFFRNSGLQNQSVLYRQPVDLSSDPEIFLDPNVFSADGTTSLAGYSFSETGKYLAYQTSEAGSDWNSIFTVEVDSGELLGEPEIESKFFSPSWFGDQGFYYSCYDKPEGSQLSAKTDHHKLYYHQVGVVKDQLVFGENPEQKNRYVSAEVSEDQKHLLIYASNSTSGNKLYVKDLELQEFVVAVDHESSDAWYLTCDQGWLYFYTNLSAVNGKIVRCKPDAPQPEFWQTVIEETEHAVEDSVAGKYIFSHYMVDVKSQVKQFDLSGSFIRDIALPAAGSAAGFCAEKEQKQTFFSFSNYIMPKTIYSLDLETNTCQVFKAPKVAFKSKEYLSKQVFYSSKDGTQIPMTIVFHKNTELNGSNPTILYGYGGFQVSLTPEYTPTVAAWLSLGGVYAVANIRGGGEYGKLWHNSGCQFNKQNVFDDFIAAAEYLSEKKYTSNEYLAIKGGSNGGLLVGAVMLQRPDLFKVVIPEVGVLDMLRYHTFTAGAGWSYDYGTAEDSQEMFEYLYAYSPLHNVEAGVNYPAILITTADHDDRVVPAHSFKFAAELQAKQAGDQPILIRIESDAGHGAGMPMNKVIEENADIYGFVFDRMGIVIKK